MRVLVYKMSRLLHPKLVTIVLFFSLSAMGDHHELPRISEAPPMKLSDLISEAVEKNSDLKASKSEVERSEAEVGPMGSYEDPMLGFEAMNYPVDSFSQSQFGMTGNQISLTQKIPFPGKISKRRQAARSGSEATKEMAESKRLEIIKQVKLAYYGLHAEYKKYDSLNEQKKLVNQLVSVTRNKYALSQSSQAEVLNLQVEEASLIDQLLIVEKQIKAKLGELNHLMGRADHSQYLYGRPEEIRKTPFDFKKYTEKVIAEKALSKSPMVKGKVAKLQEAESKLSYAKWNYLPDFEFKLAYTERKPSPGDSGVDFFSGMIGITIPLWAGSKQSEEKRGATAEKIRSEALLDEERINLSHMIHVHYAELEESNKRLQLFEGGVLPLVRQAVVSSRSAYLTKKIDYSTLLNAINKRFQMELSYAEALSSYESMIAELELLVGGSLGD